MKGLLVKDLQILRQSSRIIYMLAIIFLFWGFASEDSTFIIGYCTFALSSLATSTVSYDDYDNGFSFLFTLPITRRTYVWEKYFLAVILCVVSSGGSLVACIIISAIKGSNVTPMENLITAAAVCMICLIMVSVMLPLQMKFGAEKSKTLMFGVIALFLIVGYLFTFSMARLQSAGALNTERIELLLEKVNGGIWFGGLVLLTALIVAITVAISMRVMAKKQM